MVLTVDAQTVQKDVCAGKVRHELPLSSVFNAEEEMMSEEREVFKIDVRHIGHKVRSVAIVMIQKDSAMIRLRALAQSIASNRLLPIEHRSTPRGNPLRLPQRPLVCSLCCIHLR
jgi:hypothetical protein